MRRKYWTAVVCWSAVSVLFTFTTGCNITLGDEGEVFLEFGTKIALGSTASTTSSVSQASLKFDQNLWDWIAPNKVDTDGDGVADTSTDEVEEEAVE